MNWKSAAIITLFYSLLLFTLGYWMGSGTKPSSVEMVERIVVNPSKPPAPPKPVVPIKRYEYETVVELATVEIPILPDFKATRMSTENAIGRYKRNLTYTYFDIENRRMETEVFEYPERNFGAGVDLITGWDFVSRSPMVGVGASVRYKRVDLFAEALAGVDRAYAVGGVRVRVFGKR